MTEPITNAILTINRKGCHAGYRIVGSHWQLEEISYVSRVLSNPRSAGCKRCIGAYFSVLHPALTGFCDFIIINIIIVGVNYLNDTRVALPRTTRTILLVKADGGIYVSALG